MAKIFISYRRSDAPDAVGRVYDHLCKQFGKDVVFKDVDSIPFGEDFKQHITRVIEQSRCLLVFIGSRWHELAEGQGCRLDEPDDCVRFEIELALKNSLHIIPVLIDNATMPGESELPPSLRKLSKLNAARIRAGREFDSDLSSLIDAIGRPGYMARRAVVRALLVLVIGAILVFALRSEYFRSGPPMPVASAERHPRTTSTLTVTPRVYSRGDLTSDTPPRVEPSLLGETLFVDAIVSSFMGALFLDMRLANRSNDPQLVTSVTITAREIDLELYDREEDPFGNGVSQYYEIDVSALEKTGDALTYPVSQTVPAKGADRFVIRIGSGKPKSAFDAWALKMKVDIQIGTTAGVICMEGIEFFDSSHVYSAFPENSYYAEIDRLAWERTEKGQVKSLTTPSAATAPTAPENLAAPAECE
jgi:hypothetical protein